MGGAAERYITDDAGRRVAVILDMESYREVLEELEELESIWAYDAAKAAPQDHLDFEEALREIEVGRSSP
jgi:hypothetical protein